MSDYDELKKRIIQAGRVAVEQLIKVAEEPIIKVSDDDDLAADKLKNAAAAKRLAIFDAFEILSRIESEKESMEYVGNGATKSKQGFAERRSISNRK